MGVVRPAPNLDDLGETSAAVAWASDAVTKLLPVLDPWLRNGSVGLAAARVAPDAERPPSRSAVTHEPSAVQAMDSGSEAQSSSPSEWDEFKVELAKGLLAMGTDAALVLGITGTAEEMKPGWWSAMKFVQVRVRESGGVDVEVTGDQYLFGRNSHSADVIAGLKAVGYVAPDAIEGRPGGNSNWHRLMAAPTDGFTEIAELAVTTLTDVMGVVSPGDLQYEGIRMGAAGAIALPYLRLRPGYQSLWKDLTVDRFPERIEQMLARAFRADAVFYAGDGQVRVRQGDVGVGLGYVNGNPPLIQIVCPVVWEVEASPRLASVLQELSVGNRFVKFIYAKGEVMAVTDVYAPSVDQDELVFAITEVGLAADRFDEQLQQEFGGERLVAAKVDAPVAAQGAGYL